MTKPFDRHLDEHEIAAYVDNAVGVEDRASIEAHLAACAECRAEVAEVSRVLRTAATTRHMSRRIWIPAAAAAALALLWLGPRALRERPEPEHREEAVTMTVAPRPIAPVGVVETASTVVWSSVPNVNGYRVRLFDADGTVMWERETPDTVARIPDSVALRSQHQYYWRVEAYTGFDRRAESDMAEFRLNREGRP